METIIINKIEDLKFDSEFMYLTLNDEQIRIPLHLASQKLNKANESERQDYKISPSGYGIHWPKIDEDLSISGLLALIK